MENKMKVIWARIDSIKPYDKNAKKHPDEQVDYIVASLKKFGWRQPIVVDRDNVVVVGHGRLLAAQKLQYDTVPVVMADDLTEQEIRAYRLADNKTNESGWDFDLLGQELDDLIDIDMSDFGFNMEELPDLTDFQMDIENNLDKKKKTVICPKCGEEIEI